MVDEHMPDEWWIKDFNALYRITEQTLLAVQAIDSGVPPSKLRGAVYGLVAQLERLKPAFDLTERTRVSRRTDGLIVEAFEQYQRERKADDDSR